MTLTVHELNTLPATRVAELLAACCGAPRWISSMVARRPFETLDDLLAAADDVWWSLDQHDWREAFARHPRIGEADTAPPGDERERRWASGEQASVATAQDAVRSALVEANRKYERRFGYIYIVCATGRTADEMLALARGRLHNSPKVELRVAAEEQRKITRLRLQKLMTDEAES
ncbi:MAG TPA: 2-oxo-4-hydroxy-4-carboxy-5-ureidoimidazoline decarboxylase [Gemmatimonadaceae bacterium]|nr:2-oxo-4-hydroxy-4-carboxy-5-ureidoimidazoline decarboxylase [Acidimicrobiia bacterium]